MLASRRGRPDARRRQRRGRVADPHPARLPLLRTASRQPRLLRVLEHSTRLGQEGRAGVRQRDPPPRAIKHLDAEITLELADLLADRRLRHVQLLGGARDMQRLRHRHEVPQVPKLHIPTGSDVRQSGATSVADRIRDPSPVPGRHPRVEPDLDARHDEEAGRDREGQPREVAGH
jgi:hypothetical protein